MPNTIHLVSALRKLMETAQRFERRAARHKQIEGERHALTEAITEAQLVLSLTKHQEAQPLKSGEQRPLPLMHGMKGGKPGNAQTRRK